VSRFGVVPMKWDAGRRTHPPKSNRQASFHLLLRISHRGDASLRMRIAAKSAA